jgi:hypothetical protein
MFKRRRPVLPATLQQLAERKAIARASACNVSAAVRLQDAARGLLVRRQMLEATLVAVDLGTRGRNLALSDGHQQPRWPVSPSASMVRVPRATNSNSMAAAVGKAVPSLSSERAHCLAPPHSTTYRLEGTSAGHCCDPFQVVIHVLPFRPDSVPSGCTRAGPMCGGCLPYLKWSKK